MSCWSIPLALLRVRGTERKARFSLARRICERRSRSTRRRSSSRGTFTAPRRNPRLYYTCVRSTRSLSAVHLELDCVGSILLLIQLSFSPSFRHHPNVSQTSVITAVMLWPCALYVATPHDAYCSGRRTARYAKHAAQMVLALRCCQLGMGRSKQDQVHFTLSGLPRRTQ